MLQSLASHKAIYKMSLRSVHRVIGSTKKYLDEPQSNRRNISMPREIYQIILSPHTFTKYCTFLFADVFNRLQYLPNLIIVSKPGPVRMAMVCSSGCPFHSTPSLWFSHSLFHFTTQPTSDM